MNDQSTVCFTFDAACDAAIAMENDIYNNYLKAIRTVRDKAALDILKDAAKVKLGHKHQLEQATIEGGLVGEFTGGPVPTMNLSIYCRDPHQLSADADNRKALFYAIQMAKDALQFYRDMASQCSGAPMATIFTHIGDEQTRHLQQLEDTFEEHFLTEG